MLPSAHWNRKENLVLTKMQFLHGTHKGSADLALPQGDILWFVTSKIVSFMCSRNIRHPPYPHRAQQSCIHCFFHSVNMASSSLDSLVSLHRSNITFMLTTAFEFSWDIEAQKNVPLNWIRILHTHFLVLEMFFSFIKAWKDHWTVNGPHQFNHLVSQVYITFLLISLQL